MAEQKQINKPLRVLFAAMRWPPETFLFSLVRGLLSRKIDITVACAQKPDKEWTDLRNFYWLPVPDKRISVLRLLFPYGFSIIQSLVTSPRAFGKSYKICTTKQEDKFKWFSTLPFMGKSWDLIYFPWNSGAILFEKLFSLGIPVIISCRGSQINIAPYDPERGKFRKGLTRTLQKATAVHCVSEDILKQAIDLGMPAEKGFVIRPAVDTDYFSTLLEKKNKETFKVITTGSLIWRKGYEYALLAMRELIDNGIASELHVIGDGPEIQRILYTIQDVGLDKQVFLYGKLPQTQVRDYLHQADVFLLSSLSEGISNAVLEAMSCGLPIVTTDCGGMREAVTDGVEGFIVPIRDTSAMASRLIQLANDPDLRTRMGEAGRRRVTQKFNLVNQINHFIDLFEEVAKNERKM